MEMTRLRVTPRDECNAGSDMIHGAAGDDDIKGDAGDDVLIGSDGNDHLDGGDGWDTERQDWAK